MASDYETSMLRHELNEAVNRAVEAEIGQYDDILAHKTLGEKYLDVMHAVEALNIVKKSEICAYSRRLIEARLHDLQKHDGLPRDQRRISHALIYRVGKKHGYTGGVGKSRAQMREDGDDPLTVEPQRPPSGRKSPHRPDYSEVNARYIDALNALADGIRVSAEWLAHTAPVDDHVEFEYREMIVVMGEAFRRNIHDLANDLTVIPTNMQSHAVDIITAALSIDQGLRQFFVSQKEMRVFRARERGKKKMLNIRAILEVVRRAPGRLQPALEFASGTEAQWLRFHGQQCRACGSFRMASTDGSTTHLTCISCSARAPRLPTVFCPKCHYRINELERAASQGHCPHCGEAVDIPPGMIPGEDLNNPDNGGSP